MAIFQDPTPLEGELARQQAVELNKSVERTIGICRAMTEKMMNQFWNNPFVTPQEIADQYGNQATALFTKLAAWQTALAQIDPTYVPIPVPEKWQYTLNEDGTVTITEVVQPEPNPEEIP